MYKIIRLSVRKDAFGHLSHGIHIKSTKKSHTVKTAFLLRSRTVTSRAVSAPVYFNAKMVLLDAVRCGYATRTLYSQYRLNEAHELIDKHKIKYF